MPLTLPSTTHTPAAGVTAPYTWGAAVNAAFSSLNDYFSYELFPRSSGRSLTNMNTAGYVVNASSGGGTPVVDLPVLTFDGTATASIGRAWTSKAPRNYGGSLIIAGDFYMGSANASGTAVFGIQISAKRSGGTVSSEVFGATVLGTAAVPASAGVLQSFTVSFPTPGITAGDKVTIAFYRSPQDTADNASSGLLNLTDLSLYYNMTG